MLAGSGAPKKITGSAPITGIYRAAAWGPERTVVFSGYTHKIGNQLFSVSAEGGPAAQLTFDDGETKRFPVYSPDGSRIAFTKGKGDLYVMPAGGGAPVKVHDGVPRDRVSWSPDSMCLTYARRDPETQGWAVWVADLERHNFSNLTGADYDLSGVSTPTFSPDGSLIAFFASCPGSGPLAVIPAAGGVTRFLAPLANGQRSRGGIAWSNDSTRVAYVTGGGPRVSRMGLSSTDIGGVTTPLVGSMYEDLHSPTFRSPDLEKPALRIAA
jgi:Tol biopolymer transport system component